MLFDTPEEDANYNPLPEERPGGFAWGEGQQLGDQWASQTGSLIWTFLQWTMEGTNMFCLRHVSFCSGQLMPNYKKWEVSMLSFLYMTYHTSTALDARLLQKKKKDYLKRNSQGLFIMDLYALLMLVSWKLFFFLTIDMTTVDYIWIISIISVFSLFIIQKNKCVSGKFIVRLG